MPHAPTHARFTAKRLRRIGVASLVSAVLAVPLAGTAAAASAPITPTPEWLFHPGFGTRHWFSPNGDKTWDKARVGLYLSKKSRVTVKIRRANKPRTLVHKEELGKLGAKFHVWKWNGKDLKGRVVRDGKYYATFVGDPVGRGKPEKLTHVLWADTKFTKVRSALSLDTVYPKTTQIHDAVEVRVSGRSNLNTVRRVDWRLLNPQGYVVRTGHRVGSWKAVAFAFDGRDIAGAPLPGGKYTLRLRVKDEAGNRGKAAPLAVRISDKPLVEKVETLVVRPTGVQTASGAGSDVATPAQPSTDPRIRPCGEVVSSTVYDVPGAQSYRSADWCTYRTLPHMAWAEGRVDLDTLTFAKAPRGLYSWQASMRGRPTVAGETDTAELHLERMEVGVYSPNPHTHGSVSPTTTEESVTTTPWTTAPPQVTYSPWTKTPYVRWVINTHGTDSYDVADVTVRYSYLTPQP